MSALRLSQIGLASSPAETYPRRHSGIAPGIIDEQEYDGKPYRVFFAKDPYGVCFCFTQPLDRRKR